MAEALKRARDRRRAIGRVRFAYLRQMQARQLRRANANYLRRVQEAALEGVWLPRIDPAAPDS